MVREPRSLAIATPVGVRPPAARARLRHGDSACAALALLPALALSALLGGCSSLLSPQIFSERLTAPAGTPFQPTSADPQALNTSLSLPVAYADAQDVQRRYLTAVQEMAQVQPALNAGLLGLTAGLIYKGMTGLSTQQAAGAAALGAAGWGYSTVMVSPPRMAVYRAGAEALRCAMEASAPFLRGQAWTGQPGDGPDQGATLYGRQAAVTQRLATLGLLLARHAPLKEDAVVPLAGRPAACRDEPRPVCSRPANATPEELRTKATCADVQARWDRRCPAAVAASSRTDRPAPAVLALFSAAEAAQRAAEQSLPRAASAIRALEQAGPALWSQSVKIQLKVSAEVDKTVPDTASVLATLQGMKDMAGSGFAGRTAAPAQGPGMAQGELSPQAKPPGVRPLSAEDLAALQALTEATQALQQARVALDLLVGAVQADASQARKALNACQVQITGVALRVSPGGDELQLPAGASLAFYVAGGSGAPSGTADPGGPLPLTVEGGQFRFDYSATQVQEGDRVALRFADGAGQAEHLVTLHIVAPAGTASTPALKAGSSAAAPALKPALLPASTWALMGLGAGATQAQLQAAVQRCQASAQPPIAQTGVLDEATARAIESKQCRPT